MMNKNLKDKDYLELLSKNYPTIDDASVEIINLKAISQLPKGTEYFLSDILFEVPLYRVLAKYF